MVATNQNQQQPNETTLQEQHMSDVIQDHIENDDSVDRLVFEVLTYVNRLDEEPSTARYYLEAEDCVKFLTDPSYNAVITFKKISKYSPVYAMAIYNTFGEYPIN